MNWYLEVLSKYAVFEGRARRTEYWMFALVNIVLGVAFGVCAGLLGGMLGLDQTMITFLAFIYQAAVLVPSVAVWVRRMHDTGRSGWWFLLVFIPIIGAIALLVFAIQDSEPGTNAYGKNPKTTLA